MKKKRNRIKRLAGNGRHDLNAPRLKFEWELRRDESYINFATEQALEPII